MLLDAALAQLAVGAYAILILITHLCQSEVKRELDGVIAHLVGWELDANTSCTASVETMCTSSLLRGIYKMHK